MKDFSVTIIGSSAALPLKNRNMTAQVINHAGRLFLVDCGEGTQIQLIKLKIKSMRINHVFISHLHGDHFYGLIGLISTYHLLGRKEDLHIYAPEQLESIINLQLEISLTKLAYRIIYHTTRSDIFETVYEDDKLVVSTIPMEHRIPTTGFLFEEKPYPRHINIEAAIRLDVPYTSFEALKSGVDYTTEEGMLIPNSQLTIEPYPHRSYAFCSDTVYNEVYQQFISGCNLLYHEATFMNDMVEIARLKMHATSTQAAMVALNSGAGKLLIGHFSARYDNLLPLLEEARSIFPESYLAEEGVTYTI